MATFSVDITDVVFAGKRTGHKDITITGMPAGGVAVFITGSNPTYFSCINNPDSKGTNVYRVSTKSTNTSSGGSDRTANLKITNKSDSTDYVTVSLKQYYTNNSSNGYISYNLSNYSDIYISFPEKTSLNSTARVFFPYSLSDSNERVEIYIDGIAGTVNTAESWISTVKESTYTDTGFIRLLISCTNNNNGPRKGLVNTEYSSISIYQNGYPSSTSGCTQSISFTKSGGTESIVLNTSSSSTSLSDQYLSDFTSPTVNKIDKNNYSVTIGTNNTGSDLTGLVWFVDAGNSYIGHTIITQSGAEAASLTISPTGASVGSAAGTTSVTVTSTGIDTVEYSIEEGWVSLKTQSSNVYTFSYTANTTSSRRSCIVTFNGGGLSKSFVINQAAGAISVSPKSQNVDSTSGTIQVTVTGSSNITYTISSSWITYQSKSGNVYTFAYAENSTSSQRTTTVTFSASGMKDGVFTLTQAGASTDELTATPSSLNFTKSGGQKSVVLTYTGTLHLRDDNPDWITDISYSVGSSPKTYYITAAANTSSYAREWKAYFYDANSSIYVPIIQNGTTTPSLNVSPTSGNVDENSGRISITVTATGIKSSDINYQISGSWLSYSSRSGYTFYFEYTENTSSSRTATITFSAFGKTATYTLVQSAVVLPDVPGSLKVYPKKLRYYGEGGGRRVSFTNRPEGSIGYKIAYIDGSDWLSVTDSGPDKYVTATKNSGIRRRARIKFYDVNDSKKYAIVPVIQGNIDGYDSIWMDELYYPENRDESGNYYYRLVDKKTNAELFRGIATKPTSWGGEIGGIDIPRLVDGHIHSLLFSGSSSDWSDMYESYVTVDIYNMTENGYPGVVDATFKYCNDWSRFEKRYDYTRSLNDPINGKGCDNMIIPFCVYYDDAATFSIVNTEKNGNVNTYTLPAPSTPFAMRTNIFYDTKKLEYKQDDEVIFSYDMNHCGPGAFIYRNRFGGWDSFLIEGNIIKTDNYTKLNYRTKGEYNQIFSFDTSKYIDEKHTDSVNIDTTYEAYTGWLSDEEAERLVFHLLSSPMVFFQDLHKENQVFDTDPLFDLMLIRITASSAEYKKFRNGKKMVNYLITFEKSNTEKVRN